MKIAIVTLFTEEIADYGEIGAANKQAYARRHGYDCFIYRERLDGSRHPAWSKLGAIKRHLPNYDWVFWTDADSLVMNGEQTLELIIVGHEDKDMILTWEVGSSSVNTGEWLIRNTAWSAAALYAIGHATCPNMRPEWFEQGALNAWLAADKTRWSHLAALHPRVMNSTPAVARFSYLSVWRYGDFIIHFWPLERRRKAIIEMMIMYDALAKQTDARSRALEMRISVVIPCFNAAEYLPNAVSSILKQRIGGTEIIVVDDKSSDNTLAVAEQLKQTTDHLSIIQQGANGGPAKARNAGLHHARGEYVCFLDADDAYGDHVFATSIPILDERPWVQAVEFPIMFVNCHREVSAAQKRLMEQSIPSNIIVRRSMAVAIGGFPEGPAFRTKRAGEDAAFRDALYAWGKVRRLEEVFLEYRIRRGSHFDLYLDASEGKYNPDINVADVSTVRNGVEHYLREVRDRMRAQAGISKTSRLQWGAGDRKIRLELFTDDMSEQHVVETLTGKTYPKIPFLNNVERILDIGANIGASVIFFAMNYPNARIVGIEPARQPFVLLNRNVRNYANVEIFNVGLHNVTIKRSIYIGGPDSVANLVLRNVLSSNSQEEVPLVSADMFTRSIGMERPDIIKIDTAGCEIPIINSMIDSFRNAKAIYVEYHSEEDRLGIDRILRNTHLLFCAEIPHPHHGELVYVHRDGYDEKEDRRARRS